MADKKKPKILVGLSEVAGYFNALTNGLREIGYEADHVNLGVHPFSYGESKEDWLIRFLRACGLVIRDKTSNRGVKWFFWQPIYGVFSLLLFIKSLFIYDVYIMGSHSRFLPLFLDLPVLKLFRKKIIWVFLGSDSRPPYLDGILAKQPLTLLRRTIRKHYYIIQWVDKWADIVIEQRPASLFHNRDVVSFLDIGIPISPSRIDKRKSSGASSKVKIIHAPSAPLEKGTFVIREAIDALKNEGMAIDYVEITNKTNLEVLKMLASCDMVIDQIYSDSPMAKLAAEAALLGRPVMVGGYELKSVVNEFSQAKWKPTFIFHPDETKKSIRWLIENPEIRNKVGEDGEQFVMENWGASVVARKFERLMSGDYPSSWSFSPNQQKFVCGWGVTPLLRNQLIKNLVDKFGVNSLYLQNKPEQQALLIAEAGCDVCQ